MLLTHFDTQVTTMPYVNSPNLLGPTEILCSTSFGSTTTSLSGCNAAVALVRIHGSSFPPALFHKNPWYVDNYILTHKHLNAECSTSSPTWACQVTSVSSIWRTSSSPRRCPSITSGSTRRRARSTLVAIPQISQRKHTSLSMLFT